MKEQSRFIGEQIVVEFEKPPLFLKKPPCPNWFTWRKKRYKIVSLLQEWRNYERRGRMRMNMRPANQAKAAQRGSWGVGRYYFRVSVQNGRIFEIYYDRSPQGSGGRQGVWFLSREILVDDE